MTHSYYFNKQPNLVKYPQDNWKLKCTCF